MGRHREARERQLTSRFTEAAMARISCADWIATTGYRNLMSSPRNMRAIQLQFNVLQYASEGVRDANDTLCRVVLQLQSRWIYVSLWASW